LYLQKVLANNKKLIPPNHHKQILPINPLNLYQISQPFQPNNKQNQINLAISNQEIFLWPLRVGIAEVEDLSPWRVGVTDAKGGRLRSGAVGGHGLRRQWRWAEVANVGVVFSRGHKEREERGKILRGKM
jgi:hypothetical protein